MHSSRQTVNYSGCYARQEKRPDFFGYFVIRPQCDVRSVSRIASIRDFVLDRRSSACEVKVNTKDYERANRELNIYGASDRLGYIVTTW